jgi:hypothetical protein
MKRIIFICFTSICIAGALPSFAQTPQYTPGSVWTISMIRTKANMGVEYINSLKANWKATQDEAKAQGLILSYMILEGAAANPEDFNVMLMVETKDYATMEANREKWEAVRKKVMPDEEAMKKLNQARVEVREMYGSKMMREVIYK